MARELNVYQFEANDLVQVTDGRNPQTLPEDQRGWKLRHKLLGTEQAISAVAAISARRVLQQIETKGYCVLKKGDINPSWRKRWTKQGRVEKG
jgi:hypothetical protein